MKLTFGILLTTLLAAATVGVASADPGDAAKLAKAPKTAKFKASIKGEQVITWSYNRSPEAPCYGGENAGGSARMFYESARPAKLTAYEIPKGSPLWETLYQRVMFTPQFQVQASADFEGHHEGGQPPMPDQCDDNGGGVVPQPEDCGHADALLNISLASVNRNKLLVRGDATSWDPGFEEFRNLFNNCPWWQGGPYNRVQAEGDLTPADVKLKEKQLFDRKGPKKFVLHGDQTDCYEEDELSVCGLEEGPFRGQVVTTWKLILKRI